ncbi:MAG: NUDIX hydrolase [Thermoproteota archaeon]|nr:NUDIX hydrolase [Thermoproteota archaeon]
MSGEVKDSRIVYKSDWLEVYEDMLSPNKRDEQQRKGSNDSIKMFNRIKTPRDAATVIPIFPDGSILMIESYRRGVDDVILELPGGLIDDFEKPDETVIKELQQETGYSCKTLEPKGWHYVWPSKVNQKNFVFLAKGLEKVSSQKLESTESTKVLIVPKVELVKKLENKEIKSAETIAALYCSNVVHNQV